MSKDYTRVAAGLKAVVKNPKVSDEAKERALRKLDGLDRVSRSSTSSRSSAPASGSSSGHHDAVHTSSSSDSQRKLTSAHPSLTRSDSGSF